MEELLPVNIVIADRTFRIKVAAKDEEVVRKTVKVISQKLVEYKQQLAGKDMQDYVTMVLLWFATTQTTGTNIVIENFDLEKEINDLELLLDRAIIKE
jgi:Cell division protein ZapA